MEGRTEVTGICRLGSLLNLTSPARLVSRLCCAQEGVAPDPREIEEFAAFPGVLTICPGNHSRMFCQVGKLPHQICIQQRAQCLVYWLQLEVHHCVFQVRNPLPVQLIA